MLRKISQTEVSYAQLTLVVAIVLQVLVSIINQHLSHLQVLLIISEIVMLGIVALGSLSQSKQIDQTRHVAALTFLALISLENILSLIQVLYALIAPITSGNNWFLTGYENSSGFELLASALAIFITNVIVFALWYWEIDSPGLTRRQKKKNDQDFLFTQQNLHHLTSHWQPQFLDYLYLSLTNAINFAPADTRPITHTAKTLMGAQALVSIFTLAIVVARSVSILGS